MERIDLAAKNVDAKTRPIPHHSDRNCGTKLRNAFQIVDSTVGVKRGKGQSIDTQKNKK